MKKIALLIAAGVGYVLGTKAGRERYEQIRGAARKVADDPRVQEKAHQAADLAREKAPDALKDKIPGTTTPTGPTSTTATPPPSV
jgi:hypothetical protein